MHFRSSADGAVWSGQPEVVLDGHTDWVRDVAWAPNIGIPCHYIASCSQDRTVIIWVQEQQPNGPWKKQLIKETKFPDALWRVSWSAAGHLLAVSGGDNKVTLWKQNLKGQWDNVTEIEDAGSFQPPQK